MASDIDVQQLLNAVVSYAAQRDRRAIVEAVVEWANTACDELKDDGAPAEYVFRSLKELKARLLPDTGATTDDLIEMLQTFDRDFHVAHGVNELRALALEKTDLVEPDGVE